MKLVKILGDEWSVYVRKRDEDKKLEVCDGYTDWTTKTICALSFEPDAESIQNTEEYIKKVLRHEIVHAFLFSCGLGHNSCGVDSWATNEEMIDFFAFNGKKIYDAWVSVGAI